MSREDPQFKLRLPAELKARIDQAAADNRRSINAELVARLESTFGPEETAIERAIRLHETRETAMPGIMEIMADFQAKLEHQIEHRAREIAEREKRQKDKT